MPWKIWRQKLETFVPIGKIKAQALVVKRYSRWSVPVLHTCTIVKFVQVVSRVNFMTRREAISAKITVNRSLDTSVLSLGVALQVSMCTAVAADALQWHHLTSRIIV